MLWMTGWRVPILLQTQENGYTTHYINKKRKEQNYEQS